MSHSVVEAARWRSRAQQIAQDVWLPHSADYLSALALFMHTSSSFIYKLGCGGNCLQYAQEGAFHLSGAVKVLALYVK